jgi:hypothetical protein
MALMKFNPRRDIQVFLHFNEKILKEMEAAREGN